MKKTTSNDEAPRAARRSGFTLIEILAVVMILGLLMTLLLPAIGAGGGRSLRKEGDRVAATLELARQRAIVTGKPHRVALDLERGLFTIEWLVSESAASGLAEEEALAEPLEPEPEPAYGEGLVDLAPPLEEELAYHPIPSRFGRLESLTGGYFFEGVDTPEGWIENGEVFVVFDWDGSTDASQIVISDTEDRSIELGVAPILETVRIHEAVD